MSARAVGGKVKPRKAALLPDGTQQAAVPVLDALSHASRSLGERLGDPPRAYVPELTEGDALQVPRFDCRQAQGPSNWRLVARRNEPTLLANAPLLGDTSSKFVADHRPGVLAAWSWEHLVEVTGGAVAAAPSRRPGPRAEAPPPPLWSCYISAQDTERFLECDQSKNAYTSMYFMREPETEARPMSFAEFSGCAREWTARRVLLRAELPAPDEPLAAAPRLQAELASLVDWAWLKKEVQTPLTLGRVMGASLVASSAPSLRPLRYQGADTLYAQVRGRTRLLLVSPRHSYEGLYPYPVAHPLDGYTMVDPAKPDLGEWPGFSKVRGQAAILAPGEVLLVPRGWWVQLQAMPEGEAGGGEHTVLEIRMAAGRKVRCNDQAVVAVGRRVEELAVEGEGVAGSRPWLVRMASGAPAPPLADLATLQGYRRVRLSTAIWEEVDGLARGLSQKEAARFLGALVDRRLLPTPWLNANFREPLYLTDVPVLLPDTRSEWERRYPELFARKLQAEGWEVTPTPISVLNPEHPSFHGKPRR